MTAMGQKRIEIKTGRVETGFYYPVPSVLNNLKVKLLIITFFLCLIDVSALVEPTSRIYVYLLALHIGVFWLYIISQADFIFNSTWKTIVGANRLLLFRLIMIYAILIIISYSKTIFASTLSIQSGLRNIVFYITIFLVILVSSYRRKNNIDIAIYALIMFDVANYLLIFTGINNLLFGIAQPGKAIFLSFIGIDIDRILFPLIRGSGTVAIGVINGLLLTLTLVSIVVKKRNRSFNIFIAFMALATIALTDSRGAFLSVVLTILTLFFFRIQK